MGWIRKILGPRSKYIEELPFTYEAKVIVNEEPEIATRFLSDTICGLIEFLERDGVHAARVEIREVYEHGETLLERHLYVGPEGEWLARPRLCRSFEKQYPGHIRQAECSFEDRTKDATVG